MICKKCSEEMTLLAPDKPSQLADTWFCRLDKIYAREMPAIDATDSEYIVYYNIETTSDATSG